MRIIPPDVAGAGDKIIEMAKVKCAGAGCEKVIWVPEYHASSPNYCSAPCYMSAGTAPVQHPPRITDKED